MDHNLPSVVLVKKKSLSSIFNLSLKVRFRANSKWVPGAANTIASPDCPLNQEDL